MKGAELVPGRIAQIGEIHLTQAAFAHSRGFFAGRSPVRHPSRVPRIHCGRIRDGKPDSTADLLCENTAGSENWVETNGVAAGSLSWRGSWGRRRSRMVPLQEGRAIYGHDLSAGGALRIELAT